MIDVEDPPDALIWKGSTTNLSHYDEQDRGTGSAQCIVVVSKDRPRSELTRQ
jgi:hypothetical protein